MEWSDSQGQNNPWPRLDENPYARKHPRQYYMAGRSMSWCIAALGCYETDSGEVALPRTTTYSPQFSRVVVRNEL